MHTRDKFNYSVTILSEDHILQFDQTELLSITSLSCFTSDQTEPSELYQLRTVISTRNI